MDRLGAMRVFAAVVEARGFSAASRALRMPLPTVCRKVSELETHLGTALLVRTTRLVTVTDSGRRYYKDVRSILETVDDAERQAAGEYRQVKGLLTITAPALFGRLFILPVVNEFMRRHDEIAVRLTFTNHVLDLQEERIDLGFRIGPIPGGGLASRQVGEVRQTVCASPGYLAHNGIPSVPDDLLGHDCIAISRTGSKPAWRFRTQAGKQHEVPVRPRLSLNAIEDAVVSVLQGLGLAQFFAYQIAPHVAAGELNLALEAYEVPPVPVCLILPRSDLAPRKVQAFSEFAIPILQSRLQEVAEMCRSK